MLLTKIDWKGIYDGTAGIPWGFLLFFVMGLGFLFALRSIFAAVFAIPLRAIASQYNIIRRITKVWRWNGKIYPGIWEITWRVDSTRFPKENVAVATVYFFWKFVAALAQYKTADGEQVTYILVGEVSGTIISGRWFDQRGDVDGYFGAFQLVRDPLLNKLEGKWIGFSKYNYVNADAMVWVKRA